ncbi:MAG: hypothetical protein CSA31_02860 [Desulfobulbus propionicus]|nr:MAG: hypothetical protein CSB34_03120 [Desulfobulbus propionicus]PIE60279.1 MAG: hypothetical protein CSA31_02860 [Desulfobulbus propionicus]
MSTDQFQQPEPLQIDNKVLPVMREAITMVQMVFYKQLVDDIRARQTVPEKDAQRLAGAVVNNLFGTEPADATVTAYGAENRELVEQELRGIAERLNTLCPFLTDALRMQAICDNQEGVHSISSLLMAKALGILQEERALPMPSTFMLSVRTLAGEYGLVKQMKAAPEPEQPV